MAVERPPPFWGRKSERQVLDRLLENVRRGESGVLVIRGEAGVGKTVLLRYCARQAGGFRVAQIGGVESEMELLFAGLHQLCAPMLDRLAALPEPQQHALRIAFGLSSGDAPDRFLVVPGRLDDHVRDRIVAETRGNPLSLLELPRGMTAAELAGGFALPDASDLPGQIEEHYLHCHGVLPEATQRLMLLAAADPTGDATLLWRAAQTLATERDAVAPVETKQLLEIGARVRFRQPLVRSAVYRVAPQQDRQAVHRALAAATDPEVDPDRRAWHLAAAAPGPDEKVASELEQSAGRAQARGGLAAAAAFLERAVSLTRDPARRTDRALAAAQANLHAGAFEAALALLAAAEAGALDEFQRARVDLLRGQIAFTSSVGSDAPPLLLKAAKRLEPLDASLARETYLDAWGAALFAGRLATAGSLLEVSRAARSGPPAPHPPRPADLLLDGLAALITDGRTTAAPILRRAASAFASTETSAEAGWRRCRATPPGTARGGTRSTPASSSLPVTRVRSPGCRST